MRKVIYLLVALTVMTLSSCQNDGPIGVMFGTWAVDNYYIDNVEQPVPAGCTFSFQGGVVEAVKVVDEYFTNYQRFGSWSETPGYITLNFTHSDSQYDVGQGRYKAPEWLGMTSSVPMVMDCHLDGRRMEWTWHDGKVTRSYKLRKTW